MAKKDAPLTIAALRIKNFLGVELLEIDKMGKLLAITGPNGSGKSTVLKAIATLLGGQKKDRGLLREGSEEGELYLELSDGTTATREITPDGAREVEVLDGRLHQPIKSPESYLKGLFDSLSLDPAAFVAADSKTQARLLLEAFPVQAAAAEVEEIAGDVTAVLSGPWGLPDITRVGKALYDKRTAVNGAKIKTEKTLQGMGETLDREDEPDKDWAAEVVRLRAMRETAERDLRDELGREEDAEAEILEGLRKLKEEELEAVRVKFEAQAAAIRASSAKGRDEIRAEAKPTLDGLAAKISQAEEKYRRSAGAAKARELLKGMENDLEHLTAEWQALDKAVKGLESLKVEMCSRLPIKGVQVDEDGLRVLDGHGKMVMFSTLNTAEQIKFAVRLAVEKSGALKTVLADGLERLNKTAREAFLEEARAAGCQFLVAIAQDGEGLEVHSEGDAGNNG